MGRKRTTANLASQVGMTTEAIRQKRRAGMTDEDIIREAAIADGEPVDADSADSAKEESSFAADRRLKIAKANMAEMDEQARRLELVSVTAQAEVWSEVASTIKETLLAIPNRISPQLADMDNPREVREALMKELRRVLHAIPSQLRIAA